MQGGPQQPHRGCTRLLAPPCAAAPPPRRPAASPHSPPPVCALLSPLHAAVVAAAARGTAYLPTAGIAFVHLLAYGSWLGAIVWTTFIAGGWVGGRRVGQGRGVHLDGRVAKLPRVPSGRQAVSDPPHQLQWLADWFSPKHPTCVQRPFHSAGIVMFKNLPRQMFGRVQCEGGVPWWGRGGGGEGLQRSG